MSVYRTIGPLVLAKKAVLFNREGKKWWVIQLAVPAEQGFYQGFTGQKSKSPLFLGT